MAALCWLLLAVVFYQIYSIEAEIRVGRSDIREVLGGQIDPSFWSSRGRRGSSSEELEPPFWANRGRSESEEERPPFWGNRGRDMTSSNCPVTHQPGETLLWKFLNDKPIEERKLRSEPQAILGERRQKGATCCSSLNSNYPVFQEEPRYILVDRRGSMADDKKDQYWISRGRRKALEKRDIEKFSSKLNQFSTSSSRPSNRDLKPSRIGAESNPATPLLDNFDAFHNLDDVKFWNLLRSKLFDKQNSSIMNSTSDF